MAKLDPHYGNLIWTNHALDRIKERGVTQSDIYSTIRYPSQSMPGSKPGSTKYQRLTNSNLYEAVVACNEKGQKVVLTCWAAPTSKFRVHIPLWEKIFRWFFSHLVKKK